MKPNFKIVERSVNLTDDIEKEIIDDFDRGLSSIRIYDRYKEKYGFSDKTVREILRRHRKLKKPIRKKKRNTKYLARKNKNKEVYDFIENNGGSDLFLALKTKGYNLSNIAIYFDMTPANLSNHLRRKYDISYKKLLNKNIYQSDKLTKEDLDKILKDLKK